MSDALINHRTHTDCKHSKFRLTPQENDEIKDKGRWLRRVANPYIDFYIIMAIGATGSPTTAEVAHRREDKQVRDHASDL